MASRCRVETRIFDFVGVLGDARATPLEATKETCNADQVRRAPARRDRSTECTEIEPARLSDRTREAQRARARQGQEDRRSSACPARSRPTCSAKHVPGYVANYDKLKAKGVDEIWCIAVNDAFVMAAWGRDQKAGGKVRMMADGSADYTKKLGLELDLTARGMGVRCQRFSMVVRGRRGEGQSPSKRRASSRCRAPRRSSRKL